MTDGDGLAELARLAGALKQVRRRGWVLRGVTEPESVADHSFRTALLALVLARDDSFDRGRCVAMALVHDLAEAVVGDITPYDGISREEKRRREREALSRLADNLGDTELLELWEEFEAGETAEARLVRQLDVAETILQAHEYRDATDQDLSEFRRRGEPKLTDSTVRGLVERATEGD